VIPGKQYSPDVLLRMARRRKWLITLPALAVAVAVVVVVHFLPNRYRSDTLILVVPQRVPESYVRSTVTTKIEDRLQSISQQIMSRTRLERIIQDFNLYAEQRKTSIMEDVVERMRLDISLDVVKGDAFRVSFTSDSARTAMLVTERLASLFIDESLKDREAQKAPINSSRRSSQPPGESWWRTKSSSRSTAGSTTGSCPVSSSRTCRACTTPKCSCKRSLILSIEIAIDSWCWSAPSKTRPSVRRRGPSQRRLPARRTANRLRLPRASSCASRKRSSARWK
jgi:capsular polysaccharide biosynthesis protein